jgi:6-phosphofructokinase 1
MQRLEFRQPRRFPKCRTRIFRSERSEVTQRLAVLTSGGDAPGMNAAVRAVTRGALAKGWEVFAVRNGYAGLVSGTLTPLAARDVGGIVQQGGTVLGSARSPEFAQPPGRANALRNLSSRGIDALVVIGGNGSQTGSDSLSREGFAVVGVPSTIDNDLYGTDVSIGSDTAVNITLEAIDRLRTTASSHQRAFAVETMGRDCGYIALMAGLAGGAEVIALPESEISPAEVAERLRAAYRRGKTHALVVIAEGARCGVKELMEHYDKERASIGFDLRVGRPRAGDAPRRRRGRLPRARRARQARRPELQPDRHHAARRSRRPDAPRGQLSAGARPRDGNLKGDRPHCSHSGETLEYLNADQFSRLDLAALVFEHDEAVGFRHRAQHAGALLSGGAHFPFIAFPQQDPALVFRSAGDFPYRL